MIKEQPVTANNCLFTFHQCLINFLTYKQFYVCLFFLLFVFTVAAQENFLMSHRYDSMIRVRQNKALEMLAKEDSTVASAFWPNVNPGLFYSNLRNNILYAAKIDQGGATNFCGYAAVTHLLLRYFPDIYLERILSLYHYGKTSLIKKELKPSVAVCTVAGTLKNKGDLDFLHANQLWFLTLADQFKGYINIFDHHYNKGDENTIWAGTNYAKFNNMLKKFTARKLVFRGSDMIRPNERNYYKYISGQLTKGPVLLYVNSKYLNLHKFSLFKLRAPTHFIVLYDMYMVGDEVMIQYWDYGLKTEQLITQKRLRKLIFGVTTILDK
jgi:hypothetical protein